MAEKKDTNILHNFYLHHLDAINDIKFTHREIDIIASILSGKAAKGIAVFLSISYKTVQNHTNTILRKIDGHSREDLIKFVEKSGKFLLIQKYYAQLLLEKSFEEGLKKLRVCNHSRETSCYIYYWPTDPDLNFPVTHLRDCLIRGGIETTLEINPNLKEKDVKDFAIYVGSRDLISKLPDDKLQTNPIRVVLGDKSPSSFEPSSDIILLEEGNNFYETIISILKKIFPSISLKEVFTEFYSQEKREEEVLEKKEYAKENSFIPPGFSSNKTFKKILNFLFFIKNSKSFTMLEFFITVVSCITIILGFFIYSKGDNSNTISQDSLSIRTDLIIPQESSLLNRTQLLTQIQEKLKRQKNIQTVVLVGIGGAGKTTLARQYARSQQSPVIWEINAETKESLLNSFKNLAYSLVKTEEQKREIEFIENMRNIDEKQKQLLVFVKKHLKEQQNWVLIYDNLNKLMDLKDYFPHDVNVWGEGKVIITTRDTNINNDDYIKAESIIPVGELSPADSLTLFSKKLYKCESCKLVQDQQEKTINFLKKIPPFPLDISIAAYYVKTTQNSYDEYLAKVEKLSDNFENVQATLLKEMSDYTKTRYGIITLSLECLIKVNPQFKELLFFICLLDSQNIPKKLLDVSNNNSDVDSFIYNLKKHSLITDESSLGSEKMSTFSLHRSTQALGLSFLMHSLTEEEEKIFINKIMTSVKDFYEKYLEKNTTLASPFLAHLESLKNNLKELKIEKTIKEKYEEDLLLMMGYIHYKYTGNFILAKKYLSQIINTQAERSHLSKEKLTTILKDLGIICLLLYNPDESIMYCQKSIKLAEKTPHTELLISQNLQIIGTSYRKKNNFKKANKALNDALLKISNIDFNLKRELESEIYEQLATLYSRTYLNKDKSHMAEKYILKSIDMLNGSKLFHQEKYVQQKNPICYLAKHRCKLGQIYTKLGKYEEAMEKGFREAQYLLDNNLDNCSFPPFLKANISFGMGEVLLRKNKINSVEDKLIEPLIEFEKLVGEAPTLTIKVLKAETRIRLNKLEKAYQDCLSVFKLKDRPKHNYAILMYITCFYHAAVIKYKQNDLKKSAEHFSDFFKQMKDFCKGFLEEKEYKDLGSKGVFEDINLVKAPTKKDIKRYLKRSTQIFSTIYSPEHPFVKDYVMKN